MTTVLTLFISLFSFLPRVQAQTRVDTLLEDMTTEQKVTQLLMPDFRRWQVEGGTQADFTEMNAEVESVIDRYDFGGVILFAENVKQTEQTARLTYNLQEAALKDNGGEGHSIPLLITIDQEGGIVYRLGTGTALPGNMALGATRSREYAQNVGQIIGRELSSLGINTNLGPVLDVNNNPGNAVIGLRSFSSNPDLVAEMGVATIQGLKEYNVSGAAKHFPGHGDTEVDSHYGLPEVNKSLTELLRMELLPFQAAMDEGVDMVMTAHMMFPQLDSEYPATLSHNILTGLMREEMGYEGVIITDAMNMAAIADNFGETEAAKRAIYAGVDIVLMPTILRSKADVENKLAPMIEELVNEAETQPEFTERLNESVRRVLQLKEDRGHLDYEANKISEEEQVANALREVGSDLNRDLERKIAREAVTVVKNEDSVLPFKPEAGDNVLLVAAYQNELPGMTFSIERLKAEGVIPNDVNIETALLRNSSNQPHSREAVRELLEGKDYVVVISEVGNVPNLNPANSWLTNVPMLFTEEATAMGVDNAIMSISKPYDVANYPDAQSILAVYGAKGMDPTEGLRPSNAFGPNIPAGIEIIFGKDLARGKLPVDIPVLNDNYNMTDEIKYPYGFGLTLGAADDVEPVFADEIVVSLKRGNGKLKNPKTYIQNMNEMPGGFKIEIVNEDRLDLSGNTPEGQVVEMRITYSDSSSELVRVPLVVTPN